MLKKNYLFHQRNQHHQLRHQQKMELKGIQEQIEIHECKQRRTTFYTQAVLAAHPSICKISKKAQSKKSYRSSLTHRYHPWLKLKTLLVKNLNCSSSNIHLSLHY